MKKIENFFAVAPKIKLGCLEYCLWTDDDGALYVQIVRNLTETMSPGTHPKLLFRVSDFVNGRNAGGTPQGILGVNPETFMQETSNNNNDFGFIQAIVKHLLP